MASTGHEKPDVLIIGESPHSKDDKEGVPFKGDIGKLLHQTLDEAGIGKVRITYLVKCPTSDGKAPDKESTKACREYLDKEIAEYKPKWIVALGSAAAKAVLKKSKITMEHGQINPITVNGVAAQGIAIYSPAYCARDPSKLPEFKADFQRLGRAIRGEDKKADILVEVVDESNLKRFLTEFQDADEFSFDFETDGLFPYGDADYMRCLAIGLENKAWVIPLEMPFSFLQGQDRARDRLMITLIRMAKSKFCIGQNGKFDNHWIWAFHKSRFYLDFDTMLAHHIIDENAPHDLEVMSRVYLDADGYDIPLKEKNGSYAWEMYSKGRLDEARASVNRVYTYAGKDALYTLQLSRIFRKLINKEQSQRRLFYKLVMPGARAMDKIETRGLTLDLEKMARVERETLDKLSVSLTNLNNAARRTVRKGVTKKINWNSPSQIGKLLYEDLGLPVLERTDKGAPSTGEAAIFALKGRHVVVDSLTEYRELEKFRSTYIDGWKPFIIGDEIYFSYKIHGTVTGRYSSRLHQIPRDGTIRNLVTAPPGWTFVQADVSQAELRIAAVTSGDAEMITCFRKGIDLHWRTLMYLILIGVAPAYIGPAMETANKLTQKGEVESITAAIDLLLLIGHDAAIAVWKPWKDARKRAKAVNFGFIYGMYPKKFIETAKMKYGFEPTLEEATETRNAYFRLYRSLTTWHDRQKRFVKLDGQVRSLSGRLRRLPGIHSSEKGLQMEAERQAINSTIQGFIGDYKVMALIEIEETIDHEKLRIVGEHHDAILMIVKNGFENEVLPDVHRIMKGPSLLKDFNVELPIPMESDIELGPWGAGKLWTPPAD